MIMCVMHISRLVSRIERMKVFQKIFRHNFNSRFLTQVNLKQHILIKTSIKSTQMIVARIIKFKMVPLITFDPSKPDSIVLSLNTSVTLKLLSALSALPICSLKTDFISPVGTIWKEAICSKALYQGSAVAGKTTFTN